MGFLSDYIEACEQNTTVENIRARREARQREIQLRHDRLREREVRALERMAGIPDGIDP